MLLTPQTRSSVTVCGESIQTTYWRNLTWRRVKKRGYAIRLWNKIIGNIIRGISDNAGAARFLLARKEKLNLVSIHVPPIRVRVLYTCFKIRTKQCEQSEQSMWISHPKKTTKAFHSGRSSICRPQFTRGFSRARRHSVLVLETAFTRGGLSRHHHGRNMVMFRG